MTLSYILSNQFFYLFIFLRQIISTIINYNTKRPKEPEMLIQYFFIFFSNKETKKAPFLKRYYRVVVTCVCFIFNRNISVFCIVVS
jgi:hypothetical protein